jgi:hypothetical protein
MQLNTKQIAIIVVCAALLGLIALPNLLVGGAHDRGFLPVYLFVTSLGVLGAYLTRTKGASQ